MCFGNDDPPSPPQFGPPPPPPEFMDVIDEITGTQSVIVTGPDGKKRRVNSRLPRTPEEEQRFKAAEDLFKTSMQNMVSLYKYNPASMVDFSPLINTFASIDNQRMQELGQIANIGNIQEDIDAFKKMQSNMLEEDFSNQNRTMEEALAHSGRGSSTYAAEARAAMGRNQNLARDQARVNAINYGEELAAKKLARNKEAFNLNEMGREGQLQSAMGQYGLQKEHEADMEKRRQAAIAENQNLMGIASGVIGADLNKAMANDNAGISMNTFSAQAADNMNRYNADINRQKANYDMAMSEYQNRPPSFGQQLLGVAGTLGGAYLSGGTSLGGSFFGGSGGGKPRVGIDTVGVPMFSGDRRR